MGNLTKDIARYGFKKRRWLLAWLRGHSFFAVFDYRMANWLYRHHVPVLPEIIMAHVRRHYACEISPYASIGGGFFIPHTVGIVIGHEVVIGENFEIFQNVTIGSNRKERGGRFMPVIGDNVSIGSGSVVVGAINIGDNVRIGSNSYVDKDVPSNSIVAGIPAKVIKSI